MTVITFDIPLLIAGIAMLGWAKFFRGEQYFQMLCQFVATFAAQYSFGISWSLARLVPVFSAASLFRRRCISLAAYLPFILYVFVSSTVGWFFWSIPPSVRFWYGDGRVLLQLFNVSVLAASSVALASAIYQKGGARLLMAFLHFAAFIHGGASLYQLIAANFGLPLIGISRAHGLTANDSAGDVAAFVAESGVEIFRPGGLMGEPKSAAVLFGLILLHAMFNKTDRNLARAENALRIGAVILSGIGFLAAFSTSSFIGFFCAFLTFSVFLGTRGDRFRLAGRMLVILIVIAVGWHLFYGGDFSNLAHILVERSVNRLEGGMDPPVQASVDKMLESPLVALFGVGQGGSSFLVMEFLGASFDYAYAPNIGLILLLVESGLVGAMLLLRVFVAHVVRVGSSVAVRSDSEVRSLFIVGVSAMVLCLAGSGIPLGYPLAVACLAVAARKTRLIARTCRRAGANVRLHR